MQPSFSREELHTNAFVELYTFCTTRVSPSRKKGSAVRSICFVCVINYYVCCFANFSFFLRKPNPMCLREEKGINSIWFVSIKLTNFATNSTIVFCNDKFIADRAGPYLISFSVNCAQIISHCVQRPAIRTAPANRRRTQNENLTATSEEKYRPQLQQ